MEKQAKKRALVFLLIFALLFGAALSLRTPIMKNIYVRKYSDIISAYCKEYEVPESLVCAVIWCESKYQPDAESPAGACGLMQLTEATFGEVLQRLDLSGDYDIFSPHINIRCGIFYLRHLYGLYGNWQTVLAAYNAGMGNVNEWLSDPRYSEDGVILNRIPFDETETYVRKVLDTQEIYIKLYKE